jgi:hypothetical protein
MTALGLAVIGALAAFPVLLWYTPDAAGFARAGSIMAACAAGGLRSRSARAFYQPACLCSATSSPNRRRRTGKQAEVLELQSAELCEFLDERKQEAEDKRRGQAARVTAWLAWAPVTDAVEGRSRGQS